MANIPQQLPEVNTNLAVNSRPIDQPKPDVSMEALFKGIGSMFESGVKGADSIIKNQIQDGLYSEVDKQRGDFSDELTQFNNDVRGKIPGAALPGGPTKTSVLSPEAANSYAQASDDMPDDVSGIGDTATNLAQARAAGKISPTQYWLAIDNIAKDYRSRYPGYRDYIDQQLSSITGHNPANAYMTSIMSDLNHSLAGSVKLDPWQRKAMDVYTGMVKEGQIPEHKAEEYASMASNEPIKFLRIATSINAPKWEKESSHLELQIREGKIKDAQITARTVIPRWMDSMVWSRMDAMLQASGESLSSIQKKMFEFGNDPSKADPQAVTMLATKLLLARQQVEQEIDRELNRPIGKNGESQAQVAAGLDQDPAVWLKNLKQAKFANIDTMLQNLSKNRPELASLQAEMIQAQATNDKYKSLFSEDPMSTHMRILNLLSPYPKDVQDYFKTMLEKAQYGNPNINVWAKNTFGQFSTGYSSGKILSVDEAIKNARRAGIDDPKLYNDFASYGEKLLSKDVTDATKINIAASMFHPQNFGMLDNFKQDQIVTDADGTQRSVKGKYAVWSKYANQAMAAEISRLGEKNPEVKKWYKDWIEQGAGNDIFGQEVRDLKTTAADPRIKITYNNVTNQFNPPELQGQDFNSRFASSYQRRAGVLGNADDAIYKVNQAINGWKAAAQVQGITEPPAVQGYVLGQLKALGFVEPTPTVRPDPKALADQITNAFIAAAKAVGKNIDTWQAPRAGEKDSQKGSQSPTNAPGSRKTEAPLPTPRSENTLDQNPDISHFTAPDQYFTPDLKSWLSNPANEPPKQLVLDRATGKYVPYEDTTKVKGKDQSRVGK